MSPPYHRPRHLAPHAIIAQGAPRLRNELLVGKIWTRSSSFAQEAPRTTFSMSEQLRCPTSSSHTYDELLVHGCVFQMARMHDELKWPCFH
eukprot:583646-Pleurochrysis_carterae.AAC.1